MTTDPLSILHQTFGFSDFRGVQRQVVARVMAGAHTLATMPTGVRKGLRVGPGGEAESEARRQSYLGRSLADAAGSGSARMKGALALRGPTVDAATNGNGRESFGALEAARNAVVVHGRVWHIDRTQ